VSISRPNVKVILLLKRHLNYKQTLLYAISIKEFKEKSLTKNIISNILQDIQTKIKQKEDYLSENIVINN
jgi:hypothetical protein